MSLENVQAFYQRVAKDEAFRTQLGAANSQEEYSQIVQEAGYNFTEQEFEEFTAQLLEQTTAEGELQDLDEKELAAVLGGVKIRPPFIVPIYGLPPWYPGKPWNPVPIYGLPFPDQL